MFNNNGKNLFLSILVEVLSNVVYSVLISSKPYGKWNNYSVPFQRPNRRDKNESHFDIWRHE